MPNFAARLNPADLVAFVKRDWGALEDLDRAARAAMPDTEKFRIAAALYASARATNPAWPTDVDRLEDLQQHLRMRRIWDRAANVGR